MIEAVARNSACAPVASERGRVRTSLADQAFDALHRRIIDCEIPPGTSLTLREVAEDIGIGVTPVREALARLQFAGLIQTIPRIGYRVRPVTVSDVAEVFEVWKILGPELNRLGAVGLTREEAAELAGLRSSNRLLAHGGVAGLRAWIEQSHRIFLTYARASGNSRLEDLYLRFQAELRRVFVVLFSSDETIERLLDAPLLAPMNDASLDQAGSIASTSEFVDRLWDLVSGDLLRIPSVAAAEVSSPVDARPPVRRTGSTT